jgi:hypothetical protein
MKKKYLRNKMEMNIFAASQAAIKKLSKHKKLFPSLICLNICLLQSIDSNIKQAK